MSELSHPQLTLSNQFNFNTRLAVGRERLRREQEAASKMRIPLGLTYDMNEINNPNGSALNRDYFFNLVNKRTWVISLTTLYNKVEGFVNGLNPFFTRNSNDSITSRRGLSNISMVPRVSNLDHSSAVAA